MPKKTEEQVITTKEKETILPASPEKRKRSIANTLTILRHFRGLL